MRNPGTYGTAVELQLILVYASTRGHLFPRVSAPFRSRAYTLHHVVLRPIKPKHASVSPRWFLITWRSKRLGAMRGICRLVWAPRRTALRKRGCATLYFPTAVTCRFFSSFLHVLVTPTPSPKSRLSVRAVLKLRIRILTQVYPRRFRRQHATLHAPNTVVPMDM